MGSISENAYRIMLMRLNANKQREAKGDEPPAELESDLQRDILTYCHSKGWWVMWSRMDAPTRTPEGSPDLVVFADGGRLFIIEAKARNEKLKPAQLGIKAKLEILGHRVSVVRSMQGFLEAIQQQ